MILHIDYNSNIPIYLQLRNEIVRGIGNGDIKNGELLPTVRSLANDLQVNTMTVSKAYALLKQEGFISTDRRLGARVLPVCFTNLQDQMKLEDDLSLIASEAIIKGMKKEDFLTVCQKIVNGIVYQAVEK